MGQIMNVEHNLLTTHATKDIYSGNYQSVYCFILLSIMIFACSPKKEKVIAVDVLLTPSEEMYAQAIQLNTAIFNNNPTTIKLDKNHIPHITLLQCFINENDLPEISKVLAGLFNTIAQDSLMVESFYYAEEQEASFAMLRLSKTEALMQLHKKTLELLSPFIVKNGSEAAFVQNPDGSPISEFTVSYVPEFVEKYSFKNYDPHLSLGVAHLKLLDSLKQNVFKPINFKAATLGVYQLGDHGTAQKLLWQYE